MNYVRGVVEGANSIFHEIHQENDYGNDAFLQLVDSEDVKAEYLVAQIKSGRSYCDASSCWIPATHEQIRYWSRHKLPVVGIVFDPEEGRAYWFNLSAHIKSHPELRQGGSHTLRFCKEEHNVFDDAGFRDFFVPVFLRKPILLDRDRSRRFAVSTSYTLHSIGVTSLFYQFREEDETWDLLEGILRGRAASETDPYIAYLVAHVPGHGDIFWHKHSVIQDDVRDRLRSRIAAWDTELVAALVRLTDGAGFSRGTIGQSVLAVVEMVNDAPAKLRTLFECEPETEQARSLLLLYCLIAQEEAEPLLTQVVGTAGPLADWAGELLEWYHTEGFFYAD